MEIELIEEKKWNLSGLFIEEFGENVRILKYIKERNEWELKLGG